MRGGRAGNTLYPVVFVQEVDDDEMTNNRAAARTQQRGQGHGVTMPTSRWNIDGDELHQADVDVR